MNSKPVCIALDESGSPGIVGQVFVTAGVGVHGDTVRIEDDWKRCVAVEGLPRKGRKYSRDQFLVLVDFLLRNSILPICSAQTLNAATVEKLRNRCHEFPNFRKPSGLTKYTYAHYIWTQHLFGTIGHALVPMIRHFGPLNGLEVRVDQYTLTNELREFVNVQFQTMFKREGPFGQMLMQTRERYPQNATLEDVTNEVIDGYRPIDGHLRLDLKPGGPLCALADAVAALYRNSRLNNESARDPWRALCLAYETRTILDIDTTATMEKLANMAWPMFEQEVDT